MTTLTEWLEMSAEARSVVLDQVLERLPPGLVRATDVGHPPTLMPQFIHESGVLFTLLFGDTCLVGMTPARFERFRLARLSARSDPADDEPEPLATRWVDAAPFTPARVVSVPSVMIGECLSGHQLKLLGATDDFIAPWGVRAPGIGPVLKGLTRRRWRCLSEVEWEFASRAAVDSLDDRSLPSQPTERCLLDLGARPELCRDDWHAHWLGAPADASAWGEGHALIRGGPAATTWWASPAAWAQCLWPVRHPLAEANRPIAIRPCFALVGV